ncbi:DNA/RNA non-specific endonuclease [Danxiaibacter flavus]|uniref:DNA/RNA non-specific endonuclease n=1 Tax=Danxiaibacter flavus TaxID=3049108 RepID=A0ABV3ZN89_9BACT|nr:DNA/RNA non-specific endonuclease [Chitinophagaceae bacterium DXS]
MIIPVTQLDQSEIKYAALPNAPVRENIDNLADEVLISNVPEGITEGNILPTEVNNQERKKMLQKVRYEPPEFAYERSIGENDAVYSNFVELIHVVKRKVGRIVVKDGIRIVGYATGFMVTENLLLTNWHVFKTIEAVADSYVDFGYEYDILGNPLEPTSFSFRSDVFYYSNQALDYCLVAVNHIDNSGQSSLTDIGHIYLDPSLGKVGKENVELLNIIHHPDGKYMQLSIRQNLFVNITPTTIWYKTDTAPGSSGGPVFNDQWQVVALHHSGVGRKNANGEYVDKKGNVIPVVEGKIDASKVDWIANEGIRISVILNDIFARYPDSNIVNNLKKKASVNTGFDNHQPDSHRPLIANTLNSNETDMATTNSITDIHITVPAEVLEKNGVINISINQGVPSPTPSVNNISPAALRSPDATVSNDETDGEEIKKLEETTSFDKCKGYQSNFLKGHNIPMPKTQDSIKKFLAKINGTDDPVLKYYNYSSIFHSVRMMPLISAINVDGNPNKRLDTSKRKDVWLRDTRLSFDIQLDDAYYRNSGFEKGHMSRREDANWGATADDAKRNADLTCMYTNACPQVATINKSTRKGLWGKLETIVLEKGANLENGKTSKITVFNGPIFNDDDPVFRGIQVPMEFFKIVLWLTDNGDLKATAFKLSQADNVDNIDFEQLNLDENVEFKEYQISIKSLQRKTKIDFSNLFDFDTFHDNGADEIALNSEFEILSLIKDHNAGQTKMV